LIEKILMPNTKHQITESVNKFDLFYECINHDPEFLNSNLGTLNVEPQTSKSPCKDPFLAYGSDLLQTWRQELKGVSGPPANNYRIRGMLSFFSGPTILPPPVDGSSACWKFFRLIVRRFAWRWCLPG
jgi:hypothetical protein